MVNNPQPKQTGKFEGFFLQMVRPGQESRCKEIVTQLLGANWNVKAIGDNNTEFEISLKDDALSAKDAWDKTYNLRSRPGVVDAQPLFTVSLAIDASRGLGPFGGNQQQLPESADVEWSLKQIRVFEAWSRFFPDASKPPGHGIVVGQPDTGYSQHPEIRDNLLIQQGFDFLKRDRDAKDELTLSSGEIVNNPGHGTSAASVIVSPKGGKISYSNGKFVTGVAPGAKVVPLRVSYSVVLLSIRNLAEAIEFAANNGIHVLSISLGAGLANPRLRSAIVYAQSRGVIIVAASGTFIPYVVWPAAYDEVIAVTGSNARREIWVGSSRGPKVDVTAPGEGIWYAKVTKKDDGVEYSIQQGSGTSFSAPIVAGVAALWLSYHGRDRLIERYGAEKIPFIFNQILRDSCEKFPSWKPNQFGEGIINVEKVLAAPLPDNLNRSIIAPGMALQQHVTIDSGNVGTFTHLFQQRLLDGAETEVAANITKLKQNLAQLLQTSETELSKRLKEVGQELAFHFATNPELYKQFAATLGRKQVPSRALFATNNPQSQAQPLDLRDMLQKQGISEVLKKKIE